MSGIVGQNLGRGSGLIKAGAIDDNSVTLAKMAGLARGKLIYGDASGDPAALAVGGADEVLTHDGTDFDWAAAGGGGTNTPNFYAYNPDNQVIGTGADTAIIFASEIFDTASAYNVADGKFTVPSGENGKYWVTASIRMAGSGGIPARAFIYIFKNGSPVLRKETGGSTAYSFVDISGLVEAVATDYLQVYFYQNGGADMTLSFTDLGSAYFQGFKLIE